jgi:hypothetical protein
MTAMTRKDQTVPSPDLMDQPLVRQLASDLAGAQTDVWQLRMLLRTAWRDDRAAIDNASSRCGVNVEDLLAMPGATA